MSSAGKHPPSSAISLTSMPAVYIAGRNIAGFQGLPDVPFPEQYTRPLLDEAVRVGLRPF
ncbi:hypothetical protein AC028_08930 [Xanthomonas citri pv. aurantifolii]|nr:hypothetical protein AC028_08930 [Xanthomonas citri pv. aurantifolii]ARE55282.1 hypothetical protein TP45_02260 [Xanthomonas citri pv. aurantifolii]